MPQKQIQKQTQKPRPAPQPQPDAPTVRKDIARKWFPGEG